jgi:hypothetical protein
MAGCKNLLLINYISKKHLTKEGPNHRCNFMSLKPVISIPFSTRRGYVLLYINNDSVFSENVALTAFLQNLIHT